MKCLFVCIKWSLDKLPALQLKSQSASSDPSLQSISPSHTWLYSTHSSPSLQGLEPTRHFNSTVVEVLGAVVGHPISSERSRQWERPSHTRSLLTHFVLSLHMKSPGRKSNCEAVRQQELYPKQGMLPVKKTKIMCSLLRYGQLRRHGLSSEPSGQSFLPSHRYCCRMHSDVPWQAT